MIFGSKRFGKESYLKARGSNMNKLNRKGINFGGYGSSIQTSIVIEELYAEIEKLTSEKITNAIREEIKHRTTIITRYAEEEIVRTVLDDIVNGVFTNEILDRMNIRFAIDKNEKENHMKEEHIKRMAEELSSLSLKIEKLKVFINESKIYKELDSRRKELLGKQLSVMCKYQRILTKRYNIELSEMKDK